MKCSLCGTELVVQAGKSSYEPHECVQGEPVVEPEGDSVGDSDNPIGGEEG